MNSECSHANTMRALLDRGQAPLPGADENFLAITVGGDPHAVALSEVHGLFAERKIVPLPGGGAFLGMVCLRGGIVAVYSLRVFLGYPPGDRTLDWLILAGGPQPFALAFDDFESYFRAPDVEISPAAKHVRGGVLIAGAPRPVICLRSITDCVAAMP